MAQEHTCHATWLADVHPSITAEDLAGKFQNIRNVRMDTAGRAYLTFLSAEAMETAIRASGTVEICGRRITVTRIALLVNPPASLKRRRCSRCRLVGHNIRTCPQPPKDDDDRNGTTGKKSRTKGRTKGGKSSSSRRTSGRKALRGSN